VNDEPLTAFWSLSFQFLDWTAASQAYEQSRDLIFGLDIDASAYRILLNGQAHVVIVGIGRPPASLVEDLQAVCREGEDSPLPDEVVVTLALRHQQFAVKPGTRFERRGSL